MRLPPRLLCLLCLTLLVACGEDRPIEEIVAFHVSRLCLKVPPQKKVGKRPPFQGTRVDVAINIS